MSDIESIVNEDNEFNDKLTDDELKVLQGLHERGFAVAVFSVDELDGADNIDVEDAMIEAGWNLILDDTRTRV